MNGRKGSFIRVDDFNVICRFCMQFKEDLVDIFKFGIADQIMEVIDLRVASDDKLPQTLCQSCRLQMDNLIKFINQVKSSDTYLRSLLENEKSSIEPDLCKSTVKDKRSYKSKSLRKKFKNWPGKSKIGKTKKSQLESDKLYLILVKEVDDSESKADREISITDLNSDSDNSDLANFCKTLVKNNFSDHMHTKEQKSCDTETCINQKEDNVLEKTEFVDNTTESAVVESKTHNVSLFIYVCNECKNSFKDINDLMKHFEIAHNSQPLILQNICSYDEGNKSDILNHLQTHKDSGFSLIKVNSAGNNIPLKECEKDISVESNLEIIQDCKVLRLNLGSFKCTVCCQQIESKALILDHLNSCLSYAAESVKNFLIKYTCPICQNFFANEEKEFIQHLVLHQNIYYIKVDCTGQPCALENGEEVFLPLEDAITVMKVFDDNASKKIFKIIDINSCDKCDYTGESFALICYHYNIVHGEEMSPEASFSCPVCTEKWDISDVEENKVKFYHHLKVHKNDGMTFICIKKNGSLSNFTNVYSDVFTYSSVFFNLVNNFPSSIFNEIWCPEVTVPVLKNSPVKYTCDLCQKQFKKKQTLVKHLKWHQMKQLRREGRKIICEKCGKKCSGKVTFQKHFMKHLKRPKRKRPICIICNKTFTNRPTLDGHMKQHFREGVGNELETSLTGIICEKCGKNFSNIASLTKHKKLHLTEKENVTWKCEICKKDFFRQTSYDRHKSAHSNPKYFECEVCKFPLSSIAGLQKHSELHKTGSKTFDCKSCKISFLTRDSLTAHQTHTGHYLDRKPFECNVCHEKFFIGRKFTNHIKTHPKYKIGACTLCGKRLSTVQSLMLHTSRHFVTNSILCAHCGKQFSEERNYHRHMLTHGGVKPFSCDVEGCKKSFYTFFELSRHKKYHNNTRDFGCPFCSKSFHEANHLTVHVRTHTGERPYSCPHCQKGFVTRTQCKLHIKGIHQGIGYDLIQTNISKKVTVYENIQSVA